MHAKITVHPEDIYLDDHLTPLAVLFDGELVLDGDIWSDDNTGATAGIVTYTPQFRPAYVTFLASWFDEDQILHAKQLAIMPGENVFDFGRYRAVVTA